MKRLTTLRMIEKLLQLGKVEISADEVSLKIKTFFGYRVFITTKGKDLKKTIKKLYQTVQEHDSM